MKSRSGKRKHLKASSDLGRNQKRLCFAGGMMTTKCVGEDDEEDENWVARFSFENYNLLRCGLNILQSLNTWGFVVVCPKEKKIVFESSNDSTRFIMSVNCSHFTSKTEEEIRIVLHPEKLTHVVSKYNQGNNTLIFKVFFEQNESFIGHQLSISVVSNVDIDPKIVFEPVLVKEVKMTYNGPEEMHRMLEGTQSSPKFNKKMLENFFALIQTTSKQILNCQFGMENRVEGGKEVTQLSYYFNDTGEDFNVTSKMSVGRFLEGPPVWNKYPSHHFYNISKLLSQEGQGSQEGQIHVSKGGYFIFEWKKDKYHFYYMFSPLEN